MKNLAKMIAGIAILSVSASADVANDDRSIAPPPINLEFERQVLSSKFPLFVETMQQVDSTIAAIRAHRQKLETFRRDWLEGLNYKLKLQCQRLEEYEQFSNLQEAAGAITSAEHISRLAFIGLERSQCSTANYNLSFAWQLYDQYFNEYKRAVRELRKIESKCISQRSCREGKN